MIHSSIDTLAPLATPLSNSFKTFDSLTFNTVSSAWHALKRVPIPLRAGVDLLTPFIVYLPRKWTEYILNFPYFPYPWKPHSIEDLLGFMDETVENPTVGVVFSVMCMALFDDLCKATSHFETGLRDKLLILLISLQTAIIHTRMTGRRIGLASKILKTLKKRKRSIHSDIYRGLGSMRLGPHSSLFCITRKPEFSMHMPTKMEYSSRRTLGKGPLRVLFAVTC
jgi:hypothetical protein